MNKNPYINKYKGLILETKWINTKHRRNYKPKLIILNARDKYYKPKVYKP